MATVGRVGRTPMRSCARRTPRSPHPSVTSSTDCGRAWTTSSQSVCSRPITSRRRTAHRMDRHSETLAKRLDVRPADNRGLPTPPQRTRRQHRSRHRHHLTPRSRAKSARRHLDQAVLHCQDSTCCVPSSSTSTLWSATRICTQSAARPPPANMFRVFPTPRFTCRRGTIEHSMVVRWGDAT